MVFDELNQGFSGTFHRNAALHNSLQQQRYAYVWETKIAV
jgi:hypothetical protein